MASPVADTYSAASGASVYGGRYPLGGRASGEALLAAILADGGMGALVSGLSGGSVLAGVTADGSMTGLALPTWLSSASVGQWIDIPGTDGLSALSITPAFGGIAVSPTGDVWIAAAGGHNDSGYNGVVRCNLSADSPAWSSVIASSAVGDQTVDAASGYYPDGKPASRHLYTNIHFVPGLGGQGKVFLVGGRYQYGPNTLTTPNVDAVDVATATWSGAGGYTDALAEAAQGIGFDGTHLWTIWGSRLNPATDTWTAKSTVTDLTGDLVRYPWAYDSSEDMLFGLAWMDSEGSNSGAGGAGLRSLRRMCNGGGTPSEASVTFASSAGLTAWTADAPEYPDMDYDAANDRFLFYDGNSAGTVYSITKPLSGVLSDPWNMSVLSLTGTPPASHTGVGVFKYVAPLQGFVALVSNSTNLKFFRVA